VHAGVSAAPAVPVPESDRTQLAAQHCEASVENIPNTDCDLCTQVFALHPLYLCLRATAHHLPPNIEKRIQEARTQLEALPAVDYVETMRLKLEIARDIFEHTSSEDLHVRPVPVPAFSPPHAPLSPTQFTLGVWTTGLRLSITVHFRLNSHVANRPCD
jgi:hypothetical protein